MELKPVLILFREDEDPVFHLLQNNFLKMFCFIVTVLKVVNIQHMNLKTKGIVP